MVLKQPDESWDGKTTNWCRISLAHPQYPSHEMGCMGGVCSNVVVILSCNR
jgi:hypothetical protein